MTLDGLPSPGGSKVLCRVVEAVDAVSDSIEARGAIAGGISLEPGPGPPPILESLELELLLSSLVEPDRTFSKMEERMPRDLGGAADLSPSVQNELKEHYKNRC